MSKALRLFSSLVSVNIRRATQVSVARNYSIYPPFFLKPIYQEEEQQKLVETGEAAKLVYIPVRPAENFHNASVWHDPLVVRFTHHIMRKGDIVLARMHIDNCFERIKRIQLQKLNLTEDPFEKDKIILNPWKVFHQAVDNVKPLLELQSVKKGGHTYRVPVPLYEHKSIWYAFKWFHTIAAEKDKNKMPNYPKHDIKFANQLADELIDASKYQGKAIKKKHDLHKQCEANKAYAHYRWS